MVHCDASRTSSASILGRAPGATVTSSLVASNLSPEVMAGETPKFFARARALDISWPLGSVPLVTGTVRMMGGDIGVEG